MLKCGTIRWLSGRVAVNLKPMNVGIIGWRGMVGSVLVRRMLEEGDFGVIDPRFFSTSQAGGQSPAIGKPVSRVEDARDLEALATTDVLISCQGGDYTTEIYPRLRQAGWTATGSTPRPRCAWQTTP